MTAAAGLGLVATACSSASSSTTSVPATPASASLQASAGAAASFLSRLHAGSQIASTVPVTGDVNPYGVAVVPASAGALPGLVPAGCLIVLNDQGTVTETITNKNIVGPWDMAVSSTATSAWVFISNALDW